MNLIKKISMLACLAPCSVALASNPAMCINPNQLHNAAMTGKIYDIVTAVNNKKIVPYRWYSVGYHTYQSTMQALRNNNNHWVDGKIGYQNGNGVFCDYYDRKHNKYVDLQLFFNDHPSKIINTHH